MSVIYDSAGNIVEQQDWDNRTKAGEQLAQYVDELEADRDRLAAECKALSDQCQDVRAQRDKAQAELSAARAAVRNCIRAYFIVVTA